jgi:hypothetical protein
MLSVANHVISAASIAIFAVRVTPGQRIDWLAPLPVEWATGCNGQVGSARINNAWPALRGC